MCDPKKMPIRTVGGEYFEGSNTNLVARYQGKFAADLRAIPKKKLSKTASRNGNELGVVYQYKTEVLQRKQGRFGWKRSGKIHRQIYVRS